MNPYLDLFLTFAQIGVCTFGGGYAMLPILQREVVEKRGWATEDELMDYYAIGQCTPGVIAVNTSTFIGYRLRGVPGAITAMSRIATLGYELVMATNQDGLGTKSFPRADFTGPHELMMQILESQGAHFDEVLICPHMPGDGCECRKPKTGLVKKYLKEGVLDADNCYVIGDRETDMSLATNMGLKGLRVGPDGRSWTEIADEIIGAAGSERHARVERNTKETRITVEAWLDRSGGNEINTGVGFFDHMLTQIAVHGGIRLHVLSLIHI